MPSYMTNLTRLKEAGWLIGACVIALTRISSWVRNDLDVGVQLSHLLLHC